MRVACCSVIAVLFLASASSGQYLEKYIQVPDTWGGPEEPQVLVYDDVGQRLYYGGADSTVIGLSPADNRKVARYPIGKVAQLCVNGSQRKLYAASSRADSLYIADLNSAGSVSRIKVGEDPGVMVCLPSGDKVYCANVGDSSISVVDGRGDSVAVTIQVGRSPEGMCLGPDQQKLYVGTSGSNQVWVIDTRTDSVVAVVPVRVYPRYLASHPSGRVYCGGYGGITVICAQGDTVLRLYNGDVIQGGMLYDRVADRLYWYDDDIVRAMLCANDSVVRSWDVGREPNKMVLDTAHRRLYCLHEQWHITAIDLTTDTAYTRLVSWDQADAAVAAPFDRLYIACPEAHAVYALDTGSDSIVDVAFSRFRISEIFYSPASDRLLCTSYSGRHLLVLDARGDSVVEKWIHPLFEEEAFCFPEIDRLAFLACDYDEDTLAVVSMDAGTGQMVGTLPLGGWWGDVLIHNPVSQAVYLPAWNNDERRILALTESTDSVLAVVRGVNRLWLPTLDPVDNRVYFFGGDGLYALDCSTNTVHGPQPLGAHPYDMVYNRRDNRLCVANADDRNVYIFDCPTDSLSAVVRVIGHDPTSLAYNTRHDKLYVGCNWTDNVNVIDCRTNRVVRSVGVESYPVGMFYEPDGDKLWVKCSHNESYVVLDGATEEVVATIQLDGGSSFGAWDPARRRMYLSMSGRIAVIADPPSGVVEQPGGALKAEKQLSTILRGPELKGLDCRVIDALGRDVTDKRERLAPGVYFLKDEGGRLKDEPDSRSRVFKVVIQR